MQLAIVFLLFGTIWIVLTDLLILNISHNNLSFLNRFQTYKGVLFMCIAAWLIFFVSRKILRRQTALQQELSGERIKYKNDLALEVFNAEERERKKIGEELHDNINQLLGVVKLYIEHAQVNPAAQDEMLKKSSEYLKQIINEIRGLSKSLISPTLKDLGLMESIRELIESILKIRNIQIDVNRSDFSEESLSDIQKLMLYRITQEQLNNILKHSKAEHVGIELKRVGSQMHLIIQDDGVGFDPKNIKSGLGLKNIRHRLELFNGMMKVISSPQNGCKLEAMFELNS
jgi:two-component system sensor histidine kinase UhpB